MDGFQPLGQQYQPPSPSDTFDPSSTFSSRIVFLDRFRNSYAGSGSMYFTETLLPMMPDNGGGENQQHDQATPEEPATALPPLSTANARPREILIPSHPGHPAQQQLQHHHAHHLSHEFTPHQLNSIGPHPISPPRIYSNQTAPSGWFVPSNGQAAGGQGAVEPGSFGIQHQDGIQQSFGQAFHPPSLSLDPNPKPGTSASASVLAGSLGTVPVGQGKNQQELAMDAPAKQYVTIKQKGTYLGRRLTDQEISHHVRAAILNEERRRRRRSPNAVERRRRDNIEERISSLSTLIPESMLDTTTAGGVLPTGNADLAEDGEKETPTMKANKGMHLKQSVEYQRYLQQLVRVQPTRNRELESQLAQYRGGSTSMDTSTPNGQNLA
ncbi:hypothetical protein FRC01_005517 [Tulasnella sp. 417]|nr:hypothetical protein FRC01_005517 [Tulasnella sp. 417]